MSGESSDVPHPRKTSSPPRPSYKGLLPASARATTAARGSSKKTDTRCEVALRKSLWAAGCRYRKNVPELPGWPDVVFSRARLVVFCDGDFWHGHDWEERRRKLSRGSNSEYWLAKIRRNMERDRENDRRLQQDGWTVLRFWESQIRADLDGVLRTILRTLGRNEERPLPEIDTGPRHGVKRA
jgi:DNA mismatch endonuclease (patch repair protein)